MREAKVFKQGENWKPTQTVPRTPRLSQGVSRGNRGSANFNVKALSKPVG